MTFPKIQINNIPWTIPCWLPSSKFFGITPQKFNGDIHYDDHSIPPTTHPLNTHPLSQLPDGLKGHLMSLLWLQFHHDINCDISKKRENDHFLHNCACRQSLKVVMGTISHSILTLGLVTAEDHLLYVFSIICCSSPLISVCCSVQRLHIYST